MLGDRWNWTPKHLNFLSKNGQIPQRIASPKNIGAIQKVIKSWDENPPSHSATQSTEPPRNRAIEPPCYKAKATEHTSHQATKPLSTERECSQQHWIRQYHTWCKHSTQVIRRCKSLMSLLTPTTDLNRPPSVAYWIVCVLKCPPRSV